MLTNNRVKKLVFKADPNKGPFVMATFMPLNGRKHRRFGIVDAVMMFSLVFGMMVLMRFLLAR